MKLDDKLMNYYYMGFEEGLEVARIQDRMSASDLFEISDILPNTCRICGSEENINRYIIGNETVFLCDKCKSVKLD